MISHLLRERMMNCWDDFSKNLANLKKHFDLRSRAFEACAFSADPHNQRRGSYFSETSKSIIGKNLCENYALLVRFLRPPEVSSSCSASISGRSYRWWRSDWYPCWVSLEKSRLARGVAGTPANFNT